MHIPNPITLYFRHNDLPTNLHSKLGSNLSNYEFTKNLTTDPVWGRKNCKSCHTDLPRMKAGKVGAQVNKIYELINN